MSRLAPRHFQLNYDADTGRFFGHHEDHPLDLLPHDVRMMAAGLRGVIAEARRRGGTNIIRARFPSSRAGDHFHIYFDLPIEQAARLLEYVELLLDSLDAHLGNQGPPDNHPQESPR